MIRRLLGLGAVACLLAAPAPHAEELRVSVAVSFKAAAEALAPESAPVVRWNAGASSILAQQVHRGAPVDVILTAGSQEMDALERSGLLLEGSRVRLASNRLVLALPTGSPLLIDVLELRALTASGISRIAVGNPRTAPLGRYTAELLQRLDLLKALKPKLIYAENARVVLEYVSRGDVDAGIVYSTDLPLAEGRVLGVDLFQADSQPEILYEGAVVRRSSQPDVAVAWLSRLASAEAASKLQGWGWTPVR